jgi:hypothetical protein
MINRVVISGYERPHRYLELFALHVVEFRLYGVTYLQLEVNRRHLQLSIQHLLPIDICKPWMLLD